MKIYHFTILYALFIIAFAFICDYRVGVFETETLNRIVFERSFNKASFEATEVYYRENNAEAAYDAFCKAIALCGNADACDYFFAVVREDGIIAMTGENKEEAEVFCSGAKDNSVVTAVKNRPELNIVAGGYEKSQDYLIEQRKGYRLYHERDCSLSEDVALVGIGESQQECAELGAYACECVSTGVHIKREESRW